MKIIKTKTPKNVVEYDGEEYPANLDPTDIVEIFQTPLTGAYNWDYTVQDNRIKKLYELGKELNWNVEVDVDWSPELSDMMPDGEFEHKDAQWNNHPEYKTWDRMRREEFFNDLESANKFISINHNKYQSQLIFVHNGFAVEYKKLKTIY